LKKFVLDTNVILTDPNCIYKFEENEVYIPLIVVEELDRHKKGHEEKARNARAFTREVDSLREVGDLMKGVDIKTGGKLFVTTPTLDVNQVLPLGMDLKINDDLILFSALQLGATVVTRDLNVRLKADALGIKSEDFKAAKVKIQDDKVFSGHRTILVPYEDMITFRTTSLLPYADLMPNEYVIMREEFNEKNSILGRFSKKMNAIVPLIAPKAGICGIHPKNAEQRFAADALLNDEIMLVSLIGKAGTGKTLLAVACGLEKTLGEQKYHRILISRPIVPMGKDIGYLPGDINEKLSPYMQPIYDNLDFLFSGHSGNQNEWKSLADDGLIKVEALTYIRGRSIPMQYMIVDESQNLTPHEIKTIITRAGQGTKIVLTGDTQQIDSAYLDEINNGLTYCCDRLKTEEIVAHVELTKGERSALAEIATKLL
jgi:PhoH-like ATPase